MSLEALSLANYAPEGIAGKAVSIFKFLSGSSGFNIFH